MKILVYFFVIIGILVGVAIKWPSAIGAQGCAQGWYCYGTRVDDLIGSCSCRGTGCAYCGIERVDRFTWACDAGCTFDYDPGQCAGPFNGPTGRYCTVENAGGRPTNCCAQDPNPPTQAPPPPTNTPVPGCVPGGCDTSNCGSTPCGQGCGWNGCGTCSSGTQGCTQPTPVPVPQGVIQGCRVVEPGTVGANGNSASSQTTRVDGSPVGSFDWRQYCYSSGSIGMPAGGTHSVDSSTANGYDLGYTLCYNNTSCHNPANIVPGSSVSVSNDSIRSGSGNPFHYADLWWHYCTQVTPPTGFLPSGTVCAPSGGNLALSWNSNAGASSYSLRVDDTSNGWTGTCSSINPGDSCLDVSGTSYSRPVVTGRTYSAWIHSRNSCGGWSNPTQTTFNIVTSPSGPGALTAADSLNDITLNWANATNGEGFRVYRDGNLISGATLLPPNTTSFVDTTVTCGVGHLYRVDAIVNGNPVSCQTASSTTNGFCVAFSDHFVTRGGGVAAAGGVVGTTLPAGEFLSKIDRVSGLPGMIFGNGTFGNISSSNATESRSWLLNIGSGWSGLVNKSENTYSTMRERVLARVNPLEIPQDITSGGQLNSLVSLAKSGGNVLIIEGQQMVVLKRSGSLNLVADLDYGTEKVLVLADNNVNIGGQIRRSGVGGSFIILSGGNISINPSVGHTDITHQDITAVGYAPHLTGVFFAQGVFDTGSNGAADRQLRIDGSVIGMGGVNMVRNNAGPNPAEYVDYKAEMIVDLNQVGLRRKTFQELLAP